MFNNPIVNSSKGNDNLNSFGYFFSKSIYAEDISNELKILIGFINSNNYQEDRLIWGKRKNNY